MTPVERIIRRVVCVGLYVMMMPSAHACDGAAWEEPIAQAADRLHVDRALIRAVMQVESAACERIDGRLTTSTAGAMGLMQMMPATWDLYRERLHLGHDPYNPQDNILAGSAYLHDLIDQHGLLDGLAAYFAGPRAVMGSQKDHASPSPATLQYVRDVLGILAVDAARTTSPATALNSPSSPLFAIQRPQERPTDDIAKHRSSPLFAIAHSRVASEAQDADRAKPVQ